MSRLNLAESARANLAAARAALAAAVKRLATPAPEPQPGPALAAVLAILGERAHG